MFLIYLLAGKDNQTATIRRLACSINQYTCRAVTKEEWKLPKHVLSAWHWDIFSEATSIPHRLFSPHLYIQYSTHNLTILISYWMQWRARINPWDIAARERGRAARRKYNPNAICSRTGAQTIEVCQEELPECYVASKKKSSSSNKSKVISWWHWITVTSQKDQHHLDLEQVPGWPGFIFLTGHRPPRKTTIDCYLVIYLPITVDSA